MLTTEVSQVPLSGVLAILRAAKYVSLTFYLADLTVSKRPGSGYQIEIHFDVVNHFYLLFSFLKLVET